MKNLKPVNLSNGAVKESYVEDLSKYTKVQLEELLERQRKLLSNKQRLSKLPDNGKRIQDFSDRLDKEIANRNEIDKAAELFSELNIVAKGTTALTQMEWSNGKPNNFEDQVPDSDDEEETDPLKIIAQSRNTKIKTIIKPEKTLITSQDLEEIKSFNHSKTGQPDSSELEPHALYVCDKDENSDKLKHVKYLPHKTIKSTSLMSDKKKDRPQSKHWEVTAATLPKLRNAEVKLLTLQESIAVQRVQIEAVKEIEKQQATRRLEARNQLSARILTEPLSDLRIKEYFKNYRDAPANDDDDASDDDAFPDIHSEDEVHDDDGGSGGGVSVVVHD